jgi:hypothetical protein
MLEWQVYLLTNLNSEITAIPLTRATLFLSFIKGPRVHEWVTMQVRWIHTRLSGGATENEEYLYDTIINSFQTAFTDTMSVQRAKGEFQDVKMEKGDLDAYIARFEQLARLAEYGLDAQLVLDKFARGLTPGLYAAIINGPDHPLTWTDWVRAAQKYQQKYLLVQSNLADRRPQSTPKWQPTRNRGQWPRVFPNKPRERDPNAMDTTPGRVRARQITMEERTELMSSGKCFTCRKQGHLSRDCPQKIQRPRTNARASTSQMQREYDDVEEDEPRPVKARGGRSKLSGEEIMTAIRDADEETKDYVIQKAFMGQDF